MTEKLLLVVPTNGDSGMRETVSNIFAKAPTFTFIDVVNGKIDKVTVEENTAAGLLQGTGPIVMKNLKDKGVDIVIAREVGPGAKTLKEFSGIERIKVEPGLRVSKAVKKALKELEKKRSS